MTPTPIMISMLSTAQRREIKILQRDGIATPAKAYRIQVLNMLAKKDIVRRLADQSRLNRYVLNPDWQEIDVDKRISLKKAIAQTAPREVVSVPREAPPHPDPPPKKFVRPPAVYSNKSREQLMDEILNPKTQNNIPQNH